MMYQRVVVCSLWCVGVCIAAQCSSPTSSAFKFSITSRRNQTGHWVAQVQLGHEAGQKDAGPLEVDIDHTTAKCEDSESVLIVATVTAPPLTHHGLPAPQKSLPGFGYELLDGFGYYKFHSEAKTWNESKEICEEERAHLLVVNSEGEAKAMKVFWQRNPNFSGASHDNWAFVGFSDISKEGDYITYFNKTLASAGYVKWDPGNPNSGTNYNCGTFGRNYNLAVFQCTDKQPFFCEREL